MNRFALMGALALASFGGVAIGLVEPSADAQSPPPKQQTAKPQAESPCETFGARQRRRHELRKGR